MSVFAFDRAILRRPARSVIAGLRSGGPPPEFAGVAAEHAAYAEALAAAGIAVELLPPLEGFPDAIFVEDPALVFTEGAILLRPGGPSRAGEAETLVPALAWHFGDTVATLSDGFADGGDILVTPDTVWIGRSARTDAAGAAALVRALAAFGRTAQVVAPPPGALHLKTAVSLLDAETLLMTRACAEAGLFAGFRRIVAPDGEEAAANALRVNDVVLVGSRFPRTIALLEHEGYAAVPLETTEIGRIDAGLSCMSLRWRAAALGYNSIDRPSPRSP